MQCTLNNCQEPAKFYVIWEPEINKRMRGFLCKKCLESIEKDFKVIETFKLTIYNPTQYRQETNDRNKAFIAMVQLGAKNKELQKEFNLSYQAIRDLKCKLLKNR